MKKTREILLFILIVFLVSFASASVNLTGKNIKTGYSPFETLTGTINLSLSGEVLDSQVSFIISNSSGTISEKSLTLKELLTDKSYSCNPKDCLSSYTANSEDSIKTYGIEEAGEDVLAGFVISADQRVSEVASFLFEIDSSVEKGYEIPISFNFFDKLKLKVALPSGNYLADKNFGCYDASVRQYSNNRLVKGSNYCEKVFLPESNALQIGAFVKGQDSKKIKMSLYNKTKEIMSCIYLPGDSDSCILGIDAQGRPDPLNIESGYYYICASPSTSTTTNYYIFSEISSDKYGLNCGYSSTNFSKTSTKDFAIFARRAEYSAIPSDFQIYDGSLDYVGQNSMQAENLNKKIIEYINLKYNGNCKEGCVIPIKIKGKNQDLTIKNVEISAIAGEEGPTSNSIYDIEENPAVANFNGFIDLARMELETGGKGKKTFKITFNGEEIINQEINVLPAPIINLVYPTNIPAGTLSKLNADVELSSGRAVTSYKWEFGDGKTEMTNNSFVFHTYSSVGSFKLKLSVTDSGGFSSSKEFDILAGSPKDVVGELFKKKKEDLDRISTKANTFGEPYKRILEKILQIEENKEIIKRLEEQINSSSTEDEFLQIAKDLNAIEVPYNLAFDTLSGPISTEPGDIDPAILRDAGDYDENMISEYQDAISAWQIEKIDASLSERKVYSVDYLGKRSLLLMILSLNLNSKSDIPSYVSISPVENFEIKNDGDLNLRLIEGSLIGTLAPTTQSSVEIYISSQNTTEMKEPIIFVSPDFEELQLGEEISEDCNYNKVCEKENGETSKTCPGDCKPFGRILFWIFIAIFVGFFIYSGVAVWYKLKYEKFLFKDRRNLFNLVAFIENARNKNISEKTISEGLKKKGWNSEQVNYAIKKFNRERTGMFEILPFSKLFDIKINRLNNKTLINR